MEEFSTPLWVRLASRPWLLAGLALFPLYWAYACHFLGAPDALSPTGFLQYDQAYYMAEAREHFDDGFHLLYGSPASPNYDTPRVFFHPQTLFLGGVLKLTGLDPGLIYVIFGIVAGIIFFRIAIALYKAIVGVNSAADFVVLLIFLWGGGVAVLCGLPLQAAYRGPFLFFLDLGFWSPNLGRNAISSVEAYYHILSFGTMLLLVRGRYPAAFALMGVACVSHPFTGLELSSIVVAWAFLEPLINRETPSPKWFRWGSVTVLVLHLGYYLLLLPWLSPEVAALAPQWNVPWILRWYKEIPAYALVGMAAAWQLRSRQRISAALAQRHFRVLLAWFAVAFLLANHDIFISPRQPVHFTHGYIWTPLFLMGAQTMVEIARRLLRAPRWFGGPVLAALVTLMVLDNAAWFARFGLHGFLGRDFDSPPVYMSRDSRDVLRRLYDHAFDGGLVVSDPPKERPNASGTGMISYFVIVYTPLRAWHSQIWNTPYPSQRLSELEALFRDGLEVGEWRRRKMIALVEKSDGSDVLARFVALGYQPVYENAEFSILQRQPIED